MKTKTTLLFLLTCAFINAQSIEDHSFSNGGELISNGTNSINATIGEPIVGTVTSSQTLHQGFWAISFSNETLGITNAIALNMELNIFPNPVDQELTIASNIEQDYVFTIFNIEGKKILESSINNKRISTLNVAKLPSGTYLLKISDTAITFSKTIKFLKL